MQLNVHVSECNFFKIRWWFFTSSSNSSLSSLTNDSVRGTYCHGGRNTPSGDREDGSIGDSGGNAMESYGAHNSIYKQRKIWLIDWLIDCLLFYFTIKIINSLIVRCFLCQCMAAKFSSIVGFNDLWAEQIVLKTYSNRPWLHVCLDTRILENYIDRSIF